MDIYEVRREVGLVFLAGGYHRSEHVHTRDGEGRQEGRSLPGPYHEDINGSRRGT